MRPTSQHTRCNVPSNGGMNVTAMQKADKSKSLRRMHLATNMP